MPDPHTMPCEDVADKTALLKSWGYQILGSAPTPGMPGFCTLDFNYPARTRAMPLRAAAAPAPVAAAHDDALEPLQQQASKAIVNIFETGEVLGKYGQVTLIEDDPGHLTFGRSQTTLGSGNLWSLINDYCDAPGARFGSRLQPYLSKLKDRMRELDKDLRLHNLLRATADDPVMRKVQDAFFDKAYWQRALANAAQMQIHSALGIAVVYDSIVHGAWERMRDRTVDRYGAIRAAFPEQEWIAAYIKTRGEWLASNDQPVLRPTVYRMKTFQALVEHDKWSLELPLLVRSREISLKTLLASPPDCYDGPAPGSRALAVTTPLARGLDVRLVQLALSDAGMSVTADGVYGSGSATAVKQYQTVKGLASSTILDQDLIRKMTMPH